jgi:hypothetical protein
LSTFELETGELRFEFGDCLVQLNDLSWGFPWVSAKYLQSGMYNYPSNLKAHMWVGSSSSSSTVPTTLRSSHKARSSYEGLRFAITAGDQCYNEYRPDQ